MEDPAALAAGFEALGWHPVSLRTPNGDYAISLLAGGQPQILVAAIEGAANGARSVSLGYSNEAALTIDWGLEALRVHKTAAWRSEPGDAAVLDVAPSDVTTAAQLLSAISRDQYHAFVESAPARQHPPLADLLASTFAEFRLQVVELQVLKSGPIELHALRLFHQLLFMRFHEDRFGVPDHLQVGMALVANDVSRVLNNALAWYRRRFNSELFDDTVDLDRVPQHALVDVVRALVEPWRRLNLDFSVTRNEVAGRLYQSYLRLAPAPVEEGRLFPGAEIQSRQRQHGAYYTPSPVAGFIVRETLRVWLEQNEPTTFEDVRVIDPACGSGAFLVSAYRYLVDYWERRFRRQLTEGERAEILSASIFGIDTDVSAVMLCRVHILEEASLADHTLPELTDNIVPGDSLTGEGLQDEFLAPGSYNVVVTNPPFASPRRAILHEELPTVLERFQSLRGAGRNFAYAFVELALSLLAADGRAGLVVPRALLDGPGSAAARRAVGAEHIREIVDFGRNIVFDFTLAYIAAIVVERGEGEEVIAAKLQDTFVRKIDLFESLDRLQLGGAAAPLDGEGRSVAVAVHRSSPERLTGSSSWAPFALRWREDLRSQLGVPTSNFGDEGAPLVVIGTQTGADAKFVLDADEYAIRGGQLIAREIELPSELVPHWVKSNDIAPFTISRSRARVVVPQLGENAAVDSFIEQVGGVPRSYRPGRVDLLRRPKVLVRNLFLEPAAAADTTGNVMPPQGVVTAILPTDGDAEGDLRFIEALLNSSLYQWLLQGLAHPRTGQYGRLMAHHWVDIPWPQLDHTDRRKIVVAAARVRSILADEMRAGAARPDARIADQYWQARRQLDKTVLDVLAVGVRLRQAIETELWRLA